MPVSGGRTSFRVWAPDASSVAVRLGGADRALQRADDGLWEGELEAAPGDDYLFVLDGERALPDPCSRFQPEGIRGPSRIVDPSQFEIRPGRRLDLADLVVYELHVGTFTDEGTFDAAARDLPRLAELGVTAVELMPVATFPGNRGWGYDGIYLYAPHAAYGGPGGLARFVDAAHAARLGVILDVVYNHLGPGSDCVSAFGPYFTDRHATPWGDAIDYSQPAVREWAIQNAEHWVRDYRIDGLRLDAVFAIFDESPRHVLAELRERFPDPLLIAEQEPGNLRPIEEWGLDAQWVDEFHHELHVLLTGERDGYYADYGSAEGLAGQYARTPQERLVYCSQNHDQVGNRAVGDRPADDELALRAACLLFAPQIPLLFMGEEYGERRPFQFFTDHDDPFIAEATRAGRRRELERFAGFAGEVPDPQAESTFLASKLSRSGNSVLTALYAELLRLRRELPREVETRVEGETLRVRRGRAELCVDFGAGTWELRR